jgi:hypothetical protein
MFFRKYWTDKIDGSPPVVAEGSETNKVRGLFDGICACFYANQLKE